MKTSKKVSRKSKDQKNKAKAPAKSKIVVVMRGIRPRILEFRDKMIRLSVKGTVVWAGYLEIVNWPNFWHPEIQSFLFNAGLVISGIYLFLTWHGHRKTTLQFGKDTLIYRGTFQKQLNARTPYGFSIMDFEYSGQSLRPGRKYLDESVWIVLKHLDGDVALNCFHGRKEAEAIKSKLMAAKSYSNPDVGYSVEDAVEKNPYADRPQFQ